MKSAKQANQKSKLVVSKRPKTSTFDKRVSTEYYWNKVELSIENSIANGYTSTSVTLGPSQNMADNFTNKLTKKGYSAYCAAKYAPYDEWPAGDPVGYNLYISWEKSE